MNDNKRIGKIQEISFGMGGYDDAMLGISFTLGSDKDSWGVQSFKGTWAYEPSEHAKWTLAEQSKHWADMVRWIGTLLAEAKVKDLVRLKGVPIEATFSEGTLKEWRILTEVI